VAGDDDITSLSHTCSLFAALPNAQLAIVPGASHMCGWEQPEFVASLITTFVSNPVANRMMPVQRP
jgi:pimeloyl-ACP methyl ester carboxylesterase